MRIATVRFPEPRDRIVNMMPIIMGDPSTVPRHLHDYLPMIDACDLARGRHAYLSVTESVVRGAIQRAPGIHTDGTCSLGWGGGGWGRSGPGLGIYMASTDGACRVWDCEVSTDDHLGAVGEPDAPSFIMKPNTLYRISDRTPHQSLPSRGYRQWLRLVGDAIGGWWQEHSTPNPMGIQPNAPLLTGNKFAQVQRPAAHA